ncbi:OLC1v1011232C1 [Oldenlandia corymbosa var. corymbosa]|uniref:OLC1v1011232C1 n=1 Tax=Oldenlandia corymbosa var. corymbosa TaxID=529605 RepID=A0AAV1DT65_OLDCO|nr:OLC1v1011232C1 [Oldenlandia corymbosa var. corymbosa]
MSISLLNDRLYLISPPKFCKTSVKPFLSSSPQPLFFTFPFPIPFSGHSVLPPKPLLCRASSAADAETLPKSAIKRIAEKLRSLGYVEDDRDKGKSPPETSNSENNNPGYSPGEIFVPLPTQLPKYRVGHTLDPSWSTPDNPVPLPGSGKAIQKYHQLRLGAMKEKIEERAQKNKKENVPTLAELTLPKKELRRLTTLGIALEKKLKVGKAGITEGIVNGIHERWRRNEVVRIKCEDICRMNMKRTHELLERKTGGLVVWRSGSNIVLYRGADYKYPYFTCSDDKSIDGSANEASSVEGREDSTFDGDAQKSPVPKLLNNGSHPPLVRGVGSPDKVRFQTPGEAKLAEEADRLLEGLGPRFADWWGYEPLPVDADLLPAVVPGYKKLFRLLPYGVKPILTNDEMTILKRLGRPLPCHFALGRNRNLQGLAVAISKLWEKCEIAKIAIKRGVQNTNSELMAEELKQLTGGTLLSRDREFIVLYRGKDFLPAAVSSAIEERRKILLDSARHREAASSWNMRSNDNTQSTSEPDGVYERNNEEEEKLQSVPKPHQNSTEAAFRETSAKLTKALAKKATAEKLLADLEKEETLQETEVDKEGVTEEERFMLRKIGLRMKPFLLLGRRGVFDGTVENMHLHWKYRELVKIITGGKSIEEIHGIARTLEAESGGILIAVERVSKGYAIIIYRGKNYVRPECLRPRSLLSKREALKRSVEAQRRQRVYNTSSLYSVLQSLKLHVLKLSENIDHLKCKLAKDKDAQKTILSEELRSELNQEVTKLHSSENEMAVGNPEVCLSRQPSSQQDKDEERTNWQSAKNETTIANPEDCLSSNPCNQQMLGETNTSTISSAGDRPDDPLSLMSDATSPKVNSDALVQVATKGDSATIPFRAKSLSNKERLLLRKQALMQKKRPLFAIGKSNKLSGLAEAIRGHFRKHPLAVVNLKGRAKGTSVQEVVFKLEQATGAVLVSREPSKVILYRGWGADEEPFRGNQNPSTSLKSPGVVEGRTSNSVSQELLAAIRLECGLPS